LQFLAQQASTFAIKLMLADATADPREWAFLTDFIECCGKFPLRHQADKVFDIDVQWAGFDANRILALQTAKRLNLNLGERKTQGDLLRTT